MAVYRVVSFIFTRQLELVGAKVLLPSGFMLCFPEAALNKPAQLDVSLYQCIVATLPCTRLQNDAGSLTAAMTPRKFMSKAKMNKRGSTASQFLIHLPVP